MARQRLPTITKRISENPDVLCIESDSAVGLLERCFIELCVVHRDLYPPQIFFELLSQCCVSNVFLAFSSHNSDRLIAIHAAELKHTVFFGVSKLLNINVNRDCHHIYIPF